MKTRRRGGRKLCADLVRIRWQEPEGDTQTAIVILQDISPSGARLEVQKPIPRGAPLSLAYPAGELRGNVLYCVPGDTGYSIEMRFEPGSRWSPKRFKPQHMFDPQRLKLTEPAPKSKRPSS
jgi:hypothetical protein